MSTVKIFSQDGHIYANGYKNFLSCVNTEGYFTIFKNGFFKIFVSDVYSLKRAISSTTHWFSNYVVEKPVTGFELSELGVDAHLVQVGNECCFLIADHRSHELLGICFSSNNLEFTASRWNEALQAMHDLETTSQDWAVFKPLIELELVSDVWSPVLMTKVPIDANHYSVVEVVPTHTVLILAVLTKLYDESNLTRLMKLRNKFIPVEYSIHSDWYDFLGILRDWSTLKSESHSSVDWDWTETSGGVTLRPTEKKVYVDDRTLPVIERSFESECNRLKVNFTLRRKEDL
jgi:hypothetical protein